jgi:hypothetical protein
MTDVFSQTDRARLEGIIRGQAIEIQILTERLKLLAIENVQLMNRSDTKKLRQYAEELVSDDEPLRDHPGMRIVGSENTVHPGIGRLR